MHYRGVISLGQIQMKLQPGPPSKRSVGNGGSISGDPVRHKNNHSRSSRDHRKLDGPKVDVEYTVLIAIRACGN
jgi:hypothetical protein